MTVSTEYIGDELRDALISDSFPKEDIKGMLQELPPNILDEWMEYYIQKEKYELCELIKQVKEETKNTK